jgi:hypothetical protein
MANHVEYNLMFERLTDEAIDFLEKTFEGKESLYEVDIIDEVGPKWATIEDASADREMKEFYIMGTSAWSAPWGLQEVHTEVLKYAPDAIGVFTYTDEMPNFVGAYIMEPVVDEEDNTLYSSEDGSQFEEDEIFERFKTNNIEAVRSFGFMDDVTLDDYIENEEAYDVWSEMIWETASELQSEVIEDLRQYL